MKQCMGTSLSLILKGSATNKEVVDLTSVPICKNHHTDAAIAGQLEGHNNNNIALKIT